MDSHRRTNTFAVCMTDFAKRIRHEFDATRVPQPTYQDW